MRVLVLGGYGLIGISILRAIARKGWSPIGLGRSADLGRRLAPQARWIGADLAQMTEPSSWAPLLDGVDAVVNASGALQDGARDDLAAAQRAAIIALIAACETAGARRFVQISAPDARPEAARGLPFYETKAAADAALRDSALDWTILRPGLVISPTAYGATSLLRMLAAAPLIQPIAHPGAQVQTVHVDDVADAATLCLTRPDAVGLDADLIEDAPRRLDALTAAFRSWLGFAPARATLALPAWAAGAVAAGADVGGRLGWRSPLRSTALKALERGVLGDPEPWRAFAGAPIRGLEDTLARLPSTRQERIYARAQFAFPILLLTLSAFWLATGLITAARPEAAAAALQGSVSPAAAQTLVWSGVAVDLAIGAALLVRRWARAACLAAVAVSLAYLGAGTALTPQLWADPLGPLVKIFPTMALAAIV
ncbi:MAG: SDR family oxidoreductase, partial [Pseudomonadota bacterium]